MSGVSLRYPLKPYRLSDDLEAFFHVITFNSLRFHLHTSTHKRLRQLIKDGKVVEDAVLRDLNGKNKSLSKYVSVYYDDYEAGSLDGSGVDSGGEFKTGYAKSGHLMWNFINPSEPLEALVQDLCMMLKTHYETIDFDALEEHYTPSGGGIIMTLSTIEEDISRASNGNVEEGGALSTDPFTSNPNPGNDLNSHVRIMSIFKSAITGFRNVRAQGLELKDKTPDQFLELREWHDNPPKGPSGSH